MGEPALKRYLPWLSHDEYDGSADSDDPYAQPVSALRRILIDTAGLRRPGVVTSLARDHPDLTIVYFEGTDTIGHVFAPFAPPRQPQVSQADYDRYHGVPERYFRELDDRARRVSPSRGELARRADARLRPRVPVEGGPPDDALEQRDDDGGEVAPQRRDVSCCGGRASRRPPATRGRGSVQQVCATLLALLGLPPGRDVDGPPLAGVAAPNAAARRLLREVSPPPPRRPRPAQRRSRHAGEAEVARLRRRGRTFVEPDRRRDAHAGLVQQRRRDPEGARQGGAGDRGVRARAGARSESLVRAVEPERPAVRPRQRSRSVGRPAGARARATDCPKVQAGDRPRDRLPASRGKPIAASRW